MTFGLVYSSFSFPEWQILKMTCPNLRIVFLKYIVAFLHDLYSILCVIWFLYV